MATSKAEMARIAFNNKIQMKLALAAMKQSAKASDRRDLLDAYELKLKEVEDEITEKNELLKKYPEDRVKMRKELSSLLDRLEKLGRANYSKETVGDVTTYYKRIPQIAKEFVIATPSGSQEVTEENRFKPQNSASFTYEADYMERPDKKIPISKEVYEAAGFEEQEIKRLLTDRRKDYAELVRKEVSLIDTYVTNNGDKDLKFKADTLKEQLASDDIFFDMYVNNKEDFDGVVWDEKRETYMPIKYDDYVASAPISASFNYEYTPFRLQDTQGNRFKLAQTSQSRDAREKVLDSSSFWAETGSDFTSKYISSGRTFKMPAQVGSMTQFDGMELQQAPPEEEMDINVDMTLYQDQGLNNPNFKRGRSINPLANSQADMQRQIRPSLQRKNQNMNPVGFNMKNFLSKKPK